MNELAEFLTNNISAWNINVQHGKWFYPDPDPDIQDKWSTCDANNAWYGWEGEHGTPGVISTILNATGNFTLAFGNCGNAGFVNVLLDGIKQLAAGPGTMDETELIEFHSGAELTLTHSLEPNVDKDSFPIIQFISITVIC